MGLYESWKRVAFDQQGQPVERVWDEYLASEKDAYKKIISENLTTISGTVAELADRLGLTQPHMTAFVDGIHEAVDGLPPVEDLEAETPLALDIDFKRLYKQMVAYKAEALYTLPEWDTHFTPEEQKVFYKEEKKSHTVVKSDKTGRNDPCPCGSGKKFKKCCNA